MSAAVSAPRPAAAPFALSLPAGLWYAAIANTMIGTVILLFRLVREEWFWVAHYNKVVDPLILLLAVAVIVNCGRLRFDAMSLAAAGLVVFGVLVGILRTPTLRAFVPHLFMGLFAFGIYTAAYNARWDRAWLERFLSVASAVIVITYAATIAAFWVIFVVEQRSLYLGVLTGDLLLPFAYYLSRRRLLPAALCAALVLAAGNRGGYLGLFVILFVALPLPLPRRLGLRVAVGTLAILIAVFVSFSLEPWIRQLPVPDSVSHLENKWFRLNAFSGEFNPDEATAGRATEITSSFEHFRHQASNWLVGQGYGWSFEKPMLQGEIGDPVRHFVHLSPMNYLLTHGLPAALLFLGILWSKTTGAYRWAVTRAGRGTAPYAFALFLIGCLVWGLTIFSFGVSPMIWLTLGMLTSLSSKPALG